MHFFVGVLALGTVWCLENLGRVIRGVCYGTAALVVVMAAAT